MLELMTEIVKALVDRPDEVEVEAVPDGDATLLRMHVAPADIGKVIGKQGRTARSLRTILSAASMKVQHRFMLDIVESDDPEDDADGDAGNGSAEKDEINYNR